MKGVLFWEKENRGPLESEEVPPTSLTSRAVFCAGTHPLGTVLTTEQDQDGPPSPCPDERGKRVTRAGSASRSLRSPFPVTCWKEEPGKRAASHGDTSQVHGDSQHARNTLSVWVKDKPTCFTRVVETVPGARQGHGWEIPGLRPQLDCWSRGGPVDPAHAFSGESHGERDSPTENVPLGGLRVRGLLSSPCSLPPLASILSRAGRPGRGAHMAGGWGGAPTPSLGEDWAPGFGWRSWPLDGLAGGVDTVREPPARADAPSAIVSSGGSAPLAMTVGRSPCAALCLSPGS